MELTLQRLAGKTAFITGGANGLGEASARRLAAEGARVVIADLALDKARQVAEEIGGGALALLMDGGDEASIAEAIEAAVKACGRLDVLHNNHAALGPNMQGDGDCITTSFEVWDRAMRINLRGYFAGCKYALPHMIAGGGGSIINMASTSGQAPDIWRISYGVSKAGVIALTRAVAAQHGRQGVRCNAIAPGLIVTPYVRAAAAHLIEVVNPHASLAREGRPEDIAAMVAYFASDESGFVTGQVLNCDAGLMAHQPQNKDLQAWVDAQTQQGATP